jgi:hypothetical protein
MRALRLADKAPPERLCHKRKSSVRIDSNDRALVTKDPPSGACPKRIEVADPPMRLRFTTKQRMPMFRYPR